MKNLGKVFAFELKTYTRKKSFIITTIVLIIAAMLATSIPTFIKVFTGGRGIDIDSIRGKQIIALQTDDPNLNKYLKTSEEFAGYEIYDDVETIKKDLENGTIKRGFVLGDKQIIQYSVDNPVNDPTISFVKDSYQRYERNKELIVHGIDPGVVDEASSIEIKTENQIVGKESGSGYTTAYLVMITTYMLVILYGSIIATSVAREKSDRTMELLVTSTSPTSLIVGKVLAGAVIGVLQIALIYLFTYIGLKMNSVNYPEGILQTIGLTISLDGLVVILGFTVVGYLMYLFLFAGLGALVSKVEDVSTSVSPVTFMFIAVYFATNFAINMPDSGMARIISLFPFSSPIAMFARYSLVRVPLYELLFAFALLLGSTILLAYISIKIYRHGTLNYGNRVKLVEAVKSVFKNE